MNALARLRALWTDRAGAAAPLMASGLAVAALLLTLTLTQVLEHLHKRELQADADLIALIAVRDSDYSVERARAVLRQLEEGETSGKAARLVDDLPLFSVAVKREPQRPKAADALAEALAALHPDEMTPREALDALYRLKGLAAG